MTNQNTPADLDVRKTKPPLWKRISLVWLVPLLALVVSLGVAYQNYLDRGVLVEIAFENASGISTETKLKFRDVNVGEVEKVEFTEGLDYILVHARVDKDIAPYLDQDAQFWVVRPDVSVRGISGLDTVLSGVYIEGNWNTDADLAQTTFTGLEEAPLVRANQRGTQVILTAADGSSLTTGAPILHKGIQVGYLEEPRLAPSGREVRATAFIEAPYDRRITSTTRFWNTSGFSVSVGASGLNLNVSSLASIIEGGIAFDTFASGGTPVRDGTRFTIFENEDNARENIFVDPDRPLVDVAVNFTETVTGLNTGAEVRFRGLRVGQVSDLNAVVIETATGRDVQLRTTLSIETERLGLATDAPEQEAMALLDDFVAQGLRARLISGGLFSQSLVVELVNVEDAPPAQITYTDDDLPVLPITASLITDTTATAEGFLQRVNDLPVEELMQSATDLMNSTESLISSEGLQDAPDELLAILQDFRSLMASQAIQDVPADVQAILTRLDDAIDNFNTIATRASDADLVGNLATAIDTANTAVSNVDTAAANLPAIMAQLEALTNKANDIEIEALIAQTETTLDALEGLATGIQSADLPVSLAAALDEMGAVLREIRQGGALENVNDALNSANAAAQAIEEAAQSLPALTARATSLADQTGALLNNYGERGRFNAETLATLRDIQAAADAVSSLARAIQRNPNSLLTGR